MKKIHLMLIDDDEEDIEIFIDFANECVFDVELHYSAKFSEGIALMNTLPKVDIIFVDMHLANLTAFDVIKTMNEHDTFKNIPIVVLSSATDSAVEKKLLDLGVLSYMKKESDFKVFCDKLNEVIARLA